MGEPTRLTIAMLTYRRNAYLEAVLPRLVEQAGGVAPHIQARVLVVDNDPHGGARQAVAGSQALYVHEPEPGIVAGRNRALRESAGEDLLVFIDDDETPDPGWLPALVRLWRSTRCAAVTGPTPPVFAAAPQPWVAASGSFDSWQAADGAQVSSADTGNLLLDLAVVRRLGLCFDPRYGLTGGEDSLFTRQLTRAGGVIRFAAHAVVRKRVPPERATRTWVLRRAYRSGSSWARVRIDTTTGSRLALRVGYTAKGLARAGAGAVRAAGARARGDVRAQARHEVSSLGGLGMVAGAFDVHVREYGRSPRRPLRSGPAGQRGGSSGSHGGRQERGL